MNILLIDDEPFVLKLLARQLANLGFEEVIPCEDARDALAALESGVKAIGLVFCDLQMPQMDGVEFVRHLARIGYAGGLVLVSGENGRILQAAEKLAKATTSMCSGRCHKRVSPEQLRPMLGGKPRRVARAPRAARKIYEPDELRRATAGGELVNYYQPKVALATGAVAGVETLVRWRHPQDGLVFPDQFITIAEEHGLIDQLTRAVLTDAQLTRSSGPG